MKALLAKIRAILKDRKARRFWARVISVMASLVVFISTYALILPAITMERVAACGIEAHQHTDECYENVLVCGQDESEDHQHTKACYERTLICGKEAHIHNTECYKEDSTAVAATGGTSVPVIQAGAQSDSPDQADYQDDGQPGSAADFSGTVIPDGQDGSGSGGLDGTDGSLETSGRDAGNAEAVDEGNSTAAGVDGSSGSSGSVETSGTWNTSALTINENAADGTTNVLPADLAEEELAGGYVPELEALNFDALLTKETGFYYFHPEEGQSVPKNSSDISDWKELKKDSTLASTDLVKAYLAYSIPAGALNETNQIARYRLPANIHLTDDQILAINSTENGIAASYVIPGTETTDDPDSYRKYLGAEAVEGTRTPDKTLREGAMEYVSAVVKAENVYENTLDENGNYVDAAGHVAADQGEYLGQDLIFIFTPYTIQKNQNTYDKNGDPIRAGEKVTGWFAVDFNMDQIDWIEQDTDLDNSTIEKSAEVVFAQEDATSGTKERSETICLVEQKAALTEDETADKGAETENAGTENVGEGVTEENAADGAVDENEAETPDDSVAADTADPEAKEERADSERDKENEEDKADSTEAEKVFKEGTLTADGDSYHITLDYTAEAQIPEKASLSVKEITPDTDPEAYAACLQQAAEKMGAGLADDGRDDSAATADPANSSDEGTTGKAGAPTLDTAASRFFDIEIVVTDEEGNTEKIEPKAAVNVNIQLSSPAKDVAAAEEAAKRDNTVSGKGTSVDTPSSAEAQKTEPTVLHFAEKGVETIESTIEAPATEVGSTTDQEEEATAISFEAESFSIYGVVYTVDFHWEVDGQTYEYRLDGGDTVSFRELTRALHILDEEDDVDKFLAEIETIQFSDESLVKVVRITEGITAGALKQKWNLEPEYAASLTEAQIAQKNEKVFYAPDWALVSMKAFDTEESLTVTMQTGEQFRIQVTDAQLTKKVISASGKTYEITVTYDDSAEIPDGAELTAEEILPEDEKYAEYYGKAVTVLNDIENEEADSSSEITEDAYARFFDISIKNGDEKVEPKSVVKVEIQLADAVETDNTWSVIHFETDRPVIMESEAVLSDKTDAVEMVFDTDGFSVYGVITVPSAQPDPAINDLDGKSFTISHDSRYMTTNITPIQNGNNTNGFGKTTSSAQAATWYFERPSGSSGNTYYIYTLNGSNEKQYINLTRNNSEANRANASLSANPQPFTVTQEGDTYRLAAQSDGTTYYLDEHNGNTGNAFAGWNGTSPNGRLTLNFSSQPVMKNNGQYMALVKYEGKYYIVNNDCSLTEVEYDEATHTVAVDDPMLWTVNKNNPNGHIYFKSKEAGFTGLLTASDWYRRYLDPTSTSGYLEETNEAGAGHVDIDSGTPHYSEEAHKWYMEHYITDRVNVENNTTVSIDNTSTSDSSLYNIYHGNKNDSNYLGVVVNADGTLRLAGQQSGSNAAEFVFASPTGVKGVYWTNHTVDHIDISIAGTAAVSVPLAYGSYYGSTAGDEEDPVLTVSDNRKVELSEAQMVDPSQLRITAEDMKRATITAARADNGTTINDAFYITGYSGNVANGTSNDQVRIEGSFMVADLRGTEYEYVDYNQYMNYATWDANQYTRDVNSARKNNIVEYTVTVVKPLTYNLIDPDLGQLYDADGQPLTITVDVAFSASFNYWDPENECPAVNGVTGFGGDAWQNGGIEPTNISGMDFVLGGDVEDEKSPLVALEITKVIMDQEGNRIELKTPVNNYFDIYENKNATPEQKQNAVKGLHVVDSLNHPEWEPDPRDATIRDGYTFWRTKRLKVDDTGSAIVFDFDAENAMYYIVERHDEESLPETVTDKHDNTWTYINTYIETEYVRRDDENGTHDEYSNKTLHPSAMHTTEVFTREDGSYASIPEVAGKFTKLDGTPKKEGFLEFYVYNIYKQIETVDVPIDKTWYDEEGNAIDDEDPDSQYTWSATFELEEREVHVSGPEIDRANTTSWVPVDGVDRKTITNQDSGSAHELDRTFKGLPKYRYYYDEHGNESEYRIMYSVTETEYTLRKNDTMISHWDNVNGLDTASDVYYAPLFPHDAGDANDTSGIGENDPNFYHIIIENHLSEEITEDEIDLLISKKWDQDIELDENSFARFQLKRYKKTEYYEQEVDGNNTPVFDGEGKPVWNQSPGIEGPKEDIIFTNENHYYTLNQSDEWSLPIDRLPKTTVFEKNGHKTVNHYSYYFEEIGSDPAGFYAVFKDSDGNTLSGDENHRIEETGTAVTAENHRAPVTKLYKVDISKIAGITSADVNTGDLLEGATFRIQRYNSFSPEHKDTTWGPDHNGTVTAVVDPDHDGVFTVSGLTPGLYEIDEMTYPAGYIQADEKPRFKIVLNPATEKLEVVLLNSDGSVKAFNGSAENALVVGNTPGIALPSTGGKGVSRIYLTGVVLTVLAIISMMIRIRRTNAAGR